MSDPVRSLKNQFKAPRRLVNAAKRGEWTVPDRLHRADPASRHIKRFSIAIICYVVAAALVIGGVSFLPTLLDGINTPAQSITTSGTTTTKPDETTKPSVSGPEKIPESLSFAHLDEDERTIRIAYCEEDRGSLLSHALSVDDVTLSQADKVNVAFEESVKATEKRLSVEIDTVLIGDEDQLYEIVCDGILAYARTYDILVGGRRHNMNLAYNSGGLLLDLASLDSVGVNEINADYIDLDAPYWMGSYNDAIAYKGHYYLLAGDIGASCLGSMYVTYVNLTAYEAINGSADTLYDLVRRGNWTLDTMLYDMGVAYQQLDQMLGFMYAYDGMTDALAVGMGAEFSYTDSVTGEVVLTFDSQHTRDLFGRLDYLRSEESNYAIYDGSLALAALGRGLTLYTVDTLASSFGMSSTDEIAIIPLPKYNGDQADYRTHLSEDLLLFGIPVNCRNIEATAATLEYLAWSSHNQLRPAFLDALMPDIDYSKGNGNAEMLDLIEKSVYTDFVLAHSGSIGDIARTFRRMPAPDQAYFMNENADWLRALGDIIDKFETVLENEG